MTPADGGDRISTSRTSQSLATSVQSNAFRGGGHTLGGDDVDSAYVPDPDASGNHLIPRPYDSLNAFQTMRNRKRRIATLHFGATDSALKGANFTATQTRKMRRYSRRSTRDGRRSRCWMSDRDSPSKWSCRRGSTRTTCPKNVRLGDLATGLDRLSRLPRRQRTCRGHSRRDRAYHRAAQRGRT